MAATMSMRPGAPDVMQRLEAKAFNVQELATPRGTLRLWQHSKDLYGSRAVGHVELAHAELFVRYTLERIAVCPQWCVHDWLELTGYDTEVRVALTQLGLDHYDRYESIVVGTSSRIVAMGVSVANIALRLKVKVYSSRATLCEEALATLGHAKHADASRLRL